MNSSIRSAHTNNQHIGRYELISLISEGSGGIVWKAKSPNHTEVALKFLKWSPLKSRKQSAERFKSEFAILKSLSHPNISKIFDFGYDSHSNLYYFTTELITGGDLKTLINAPIPIIEKLLLDALRALEYLSNVKLHHLDIKPQNLLIKNTDQGPCLAVIDFGLATLRPPNKPGGTANYMPPEIIVRRLDMPEHNYPTPDLRSDLYSLGVSFYYCLTGITPFTEKTSDGKRINTLATLQNHLNLDIEPPSVHREEIPKYLDRIIMKLMARHPDDRFASPIIAAQALQYCSPYTLASENTESLLSYLPKQGKLIGRHQQKKSIEVLISTIKDNQPFIPTFVFIAGKKGTGRTRLLHSIKSYTQQHEFDVILSNELTGEISQQISSGIELIDNSSFDYKMLLIDDIHEVLESPQSQCMNFSTEDNENPLLKLIHQLEFQYKLHQGIKAKTVIIATINTDKMTTAHAKKILNAKEPIYHNICLDNFSHAEVSEYLHALLGEHPDPAITDQLIQYTHGNPLFLTEHLENMIAHGRLFSLTGRPDPDTLKSIGLDFSQAPYSMSLEQSIRTQFTQLNIQAKEILNIMACMNQPISSSDVKSLCRYKLIDLFLLKLVQSGLIQRNNNGYFEFANAVIMPFLLKRMTAKTHKRIHGIIYHYLSSQLATGNHRLLQHYAYSQYNASSINDFYTLSDHAIKNNHKPLAIKYLHDILNLLPLNNIFKRSDCLIQIGELYEEIHQWDNAKCYYNKIKKISAPRTYQLELILISNEKTARLALRRRELNKCKRIITQSLHLIAKKRAPKFIIWQLRFENYLGSIDMRSGDNQHAILRFKKTHKDATKLLTHVNQRKITNNELGEALLREGHATQALSIFLKDLKNAATVHAESKLHYLIGNTFRNIKINNLKEAKIHYLKGLSIAEKNRLTSLELRLQAGIGNVYFEQGLQQEALDNYRKAFKLAQQVDSSTTSVELMVDMGLASLQLGNMDQGIEYLEAALDFANNPNSRAAGIIKQYSPTIYISLADAFYRKKDFHRTFEYLDHAAVLDKQGKLAPELRYSLYGTYAEIHLLYGDYDKVLKMLPSLKMLAQEFPPAATHFKSLKKRISSLS